MTTLTLSVTADRARDDLRAGDRVVALDGHTLPRARTVSNPKHIAGPNQIPAVNLVNESGSDVEWNLYLWGISEVTIEREVQEQAAPDAKEPTKRRTRTVGDVVLVSHGDGYWESEDGDWVISREQRGTTVCDEPHPVKITKSMIEYATDHPGNPFSRDVMFAVRSGRKGYWCEGGAEHEGEPVWILDSGTYRVNELFTRFGDALEALRSELER